MWIILRKLRLIVPILFTSLLTSFFLLVQICLLESSCHDGLSQLVSTHREVLNSMVGRRYSQSTLQPPLGMTHDYDENINGSIIQGVVKSDASRSVGQGVVTSVVDDTNNVINVTELVTQSHVNISTTKSSLRTHMTSSQSISELSTHASIQQAKYTEISKSAFYMVQAFQSHHCSLPHCMDYLSNFDKACIDYCIEKQQKKRGKGKKHHVTHDYGMHMHGDCRFMQGGKRAAVALASLPGSGNTWVRGLLEKATGICTGSVYCDVNLKGAGFNGEAMRSGTVLVVKTHKAEVTWTDVNKPGYNKKGVPQYGAVILLLRNPYNAMVAEWNREEARRLAKFARSDHAAQDNTTTYISHTGSVGPEQFGTNPAWNAFIHQKMSKWTSYIVNMIVELPSNRTRMVVRFEDFQKDRVRAVSQILDFIYFPYTYETLTEHLKDDFVVFRRNHHAAFEAFTETQEQYMERELGKILDKLARVNNGETYRIEDYLRKPRIT